jgi:hypothetical protein
MKTIILLFGVLTSFFSSAQIKAKIVPIDKSIHKLSGDTIKSVNKLPSGYVITINKTTNKKDTSLSYEEIILVFDEKKRKTKS